MRPQTRPSDVRALVLVAVLVLAGCAGVGGPEGSTGGDGGVGPVTPVPVPDADERSADLIGIGSEGVVDPKLIGDAHANRTLEGSYTLVSEQMIWRLDGTVLSSYLLRLQLDADLSYFAAAETAGQAAPGLLGPPPASAEFWSNGTTHLYASERTNGSYEEFSPRGAIGTWRYWATSGAFPSLASDTPSTVVRSSFAAVPTTTEDRRTIEGTTRYRLAGSRNVTDDLPFEEASPARNVTLVADVDETGFVRHLKLEYRGTLDGEPVVVTRRFSYVGVGETEVGGPPWSGDI